MTAKLEVVTAPDEPTLFDSLARLVPEDLRAEYYRVLAHTRSLAPDDEMLRILEAMDILTLLTRRLPKELEEERARFFEVLARYQKSSTDAEAGMREYLRVIEARIANLPEEIKTSLNPRELAKLLGESIRQEFVRTTLLETAQALRVTSATVADAQEGLAKALERLCNRRYGVLAQVESANSYLTHSLESRAKRIDELLVEVKGDILRIWVPILCGAALLIGAFAGAGIQRCRDDRVASGPQPAVAIPSEAPATGTPPGNTENGSRQQPEHRNPSWR